MNRWIIHQVVPYLLSIHCTDIVTSIDLSYISMLFYLYFDCMYSNKKRKCYQFHLNATFRKSQKLIPSKKNQSLPIAKISSRKTQKIANPQN